MIAELFPLYELLQTRVQAEIVDEEYHENRVRFNPRIPKGPQTTLWNQFVARMLQLARLELDSPRGPSWTIDISKQMTLAPDLRWGWRVILQSPAIAETVLAIATDLKGLRVRSSQIEEVRLVGSPNRSRTAGPTGTVPVGAELLFRGR
jgi:hypothetical protein